MLHKTPAVSIAFMFALLLSQRGLDLHAAGLSTIDDEVRASDKTGRRAGQKRHRFGHFVRATEAAHGQEQ